MDKNTPKYLVSHYDERYWRLGRFITIFVVISIVLIVKQEDPDKIQDARGLLKSIGLQSPIYGQLELKKNPFSFGLFLYKTCLPVPHWPEMYKLWLFIAIDMPGFFVFFFQTSPSWSA